MSEWAAKRFWTSASVAPVEAGFAILLDGRAVKTPAKRALELPSRALAEGIAAEWDAQEDQIRPETMPLTRAANAAIDKVATQQAEVAAMLAAYAETDLLCHRADPAIQPDLAAQQAENWDSLLKICADREHPLRAGPGVLPHVQPPETLAHYQARMAAMSPWELTALHDLIALTGSIVLGLAVFDGDLEGEEAWRLSRLDEDFQAAQWGVDEEAAEIAALKTGAHAQAVSFLKLLRHN